MPDRLFWRILSLRSRFVCQKALSFHCLPITSPSFVLLLFLSTQKDTQHCQMSSCGKVLFFWERILICPHQGNRNRRTRTFALVYSWDCSRPPSPLRLLSPLSYVPMLPGCWDPAAVKIYNTEVNVTTMSASVFQPTDDTIKSRKYPLLVTHF